MWAGIGSGMQVSISRSVQPQLHIVPVFRRDKADGRRSVCEKGITVAGFVGRVRHAERSSLDRWIVILHVIQMSRRNREPGRVFFDLSSLAAC